MTNYTYGIQAARSTARQLTFEIARFGREMSGSGMSGAGISGVPAVDLFSGAGGLSLGARLAGCDVRLSVDTDPLACETLRRNEAALGGFVSDKNVRELVGADLRALAGIGRREEMVVVGGPPCQGFSKAAFWLEDGDDAKYRRARAAGHSISRPAANAAPPRPDERRSLIYEFFRLTVEAQASGFVFENVSSILAARHRPMLDSLLHEFHGAGYATTLVKANAVEFGVAQRRQRVFILGSRRHSPIAPLATHFFGDDPGDGRLPATTAEKALAPFSSEAFAEPEEVVTGRWAEHLTDIPPGSNYKFHTAWAGHPDPTFVTETRFWNFLLKLAPQLPSWTIAASPGPWTGPFHWESRRLRTVEMAALQGFPTDYTFAGNRRDRVRQIGNAVPPPLARQMVGSVVASLSA